MPNREIKKRILNISYAHNLSHLGSCLTVVDLIETIYSLKKDDVFVLDNAHAALALYSVIEKYKGKDAEKLFEIHGVHQNRDVENDLYVSGGSLGLAGSIAMGMAYSRKPKNVWCVTSDGAMMEGIWAETLRVAAEQKLDNFKLAINCNGYGAMREIESEQIINMLRAFGWGVYVAKTVQELKDGFSAYISGTPVAVVYLSNMDEYPKYLQGINGHYQALDEKQYREVMNVL